MGLALDIVALGQDFLEVLLCSPVSIVPSVLRIHLSLMLYDLSS